VCGVTCRNRTSARGALSLAKRINRVLLIPMNNHLSNSYLGNVKFRKQHKKMQDDDVR
jgi:hypothetical protein